jgi:hypothetical protein
MSGICYIKVQSKLLRKEIIYTALLMALYIIDLQNSKKGYKPLIFMSIQLLLFVLIYHSKNQIYTLGYCMNVFEFNGLP